MGKGLWKLGLAALAIGSLPFAARVQAAPPPPVAVPSTVAGWAEFVETLRTLPDRMLAKLPEAQRTDPQIQQEVARLALESLATSTIAALGADGDNPVFLPAIGQILNVGQPNADTIYRTARLTPGASYRLRGKAGSLNQAVIAQVVQGKGPRSLLHLRDLRLDGQGRFDVLLAPERPAGHSGDFWEIEPGTGSLMVRMVSADWAGETSPTLAIERIDRAQARPRLPAAALEGALRALPKQVDFMALMFVDHVAKLRGEGYVNKLKVFDVEVGALAGQFYYEGAYDLADDEALIVESPVPAKCGYRSLILTNDLFETTDWINNHSSLNHAQAAPDPDGKLRIVVSARDPGVANWLDTAGYPTGVIQGRWTDCDSQPVPVTRLVKLADLRKHLPAGVSAVTPEQRQEILRERRRAYQERPQW